MSNHVFRHQQGYIEVASIGDQTDEVVAATKQELMALAKKVQRSGEPVTILTDLTKIGKQTTASRRLARDILDTVPFRKIAIYGANVFLKHVVNFILTGSGHRRHARYFDSRPAAEAWLRS